MIPRVLLPERLVLDGAEKDTPFSRRPVRPDDEGCSIIQRNAGVAVVAKEAEQIIWWWSRRVRLGDPEWLAKRLASVIGNRGPNAVRRQRR